MACRDPGRGEQARELIRRWSPAAFARTELRQLDLASLESVRRFAEAVAAQVPTLDLLINNAGIMAIPFGLSADGFELQFATNHLGHFALTGRLLGGLLARPGARVVTVSSAAAVLGRLDCIDPRGRRYHRWRAYGTSKLANQSFALELDRRVRRAGLDLRSVAAHPGYAATNLQAAAPRGQGNRLMEWMTEVANAIFAQPAAIGALPQLYAATCPEIRGGEYVGPAGLAGLRGYPRVIRPLPAALDEVAAVKLWELSVELTGVGFEKLEP